MCSVSPRGSRSNVMGCGIPDRGKSASSLADLNTGKRYTSSHRNDPYRSKRARNLSGAGTPRNLHLGFQLTNSREIWVSKLVQSGHHTHISSIAAKSLTVLLNQVITENYMLPHVNIHSCGTHLLEAYLLIIIVVAVSSIGACTPFISNTPGKTTKVVCSPTNVWA